MKIISGGQTGADRAALDVAITLGLPHGGWCPKGRRSEIGPIPALYQLRETPSPTYIQRTEWNARDSDATVIFTFRTDLRGGSRLTSQFAKQYKRPLLHISRDLDSHPALTLTTFLQSHKINTLNVAGSRESSEPGIGSWVASVLCLAIFHIGFVPPHHPITKTSNRQKS